MIFTPQSKEFLRKILNEDGHGVPKFVEAWVDNDVSIIMAYIKGLRLYFVS